MAEKSKEEFVGMGKNPNPKVPDIPIGLGMSLAQHTQALSCFGRLSDADKTRVIDYVQSSASGGEAEEKIQKAVEMLEQGRMESFG